MGQRYPNSTVEDCIGFFHGMQRHYKKVTIWSQGIDSLWLNAVVARAKELASVEFVTLVSGHNVPAIVAAVSLQANVPTHQMPSLKRILAIFYLHGRHIIYHPHR